MVLKIGAIIEMVTTRGYRYAQYTHQDKKIGELIRVIKDTYKEPQTDFSSLVTKPTAFYAFIPLQAYIKRKHIKHVGDCSVPEAFHKFPILKSPILNSKDEIIAWTFSDGATEWRQDKLEESQKDLSDQMVWFYSLLERRLNDDYHSADCKIEKIK